MSITLYNPYVFYDGMVSSERKVNGNILGFTGYAWLQIANAGGSIDPVLVEKVWNLAQKDPKKPGLLNRYPGYTEYTPMEDYWGFSAGLYAMQRPDLVTQIRDRWDKNWGIMNSGGALDIPRAVFSRMPSLYAHLVYSEGKNPSEGYKRAWRAKLGGNLGNRTQDGIFQNWSMIMSYYRSPWKDHDGNLAVNGWWDEMSAHRLSMRQTAIDYTQLPDHPIVTYWSDCRSFRI